MRNLIHSTKYGSMDISKIKFDKRSRDELPQLLEGLQYLYVTPKIHEELFALLEKEILPNVDKKNGRPGMELWKILVLSLLRLTMNWNYDRLHDTVNHHSLVRNMLGHVDSDKSYYPLQTLKDNIVLLTPELLDKINQIIIRTGHDCVKKKRK